MYAESLKELPCVLKMPKSTFPPFSVSLYIEAVPPPFFPSLHEKEKVQLGGQAICAQPSLSKKKTVKIIVSDKFINAK